MADGILLTFPAQPLEQTRLGTSRVLEAAHSWHVLADPSHHALHLPWCGSPCKAAELPGSR